MILKRLSKHKSRLLKLMLLGLTLLLTGCQRGMLRPEGRIAAEQRDLLIFATVLILIVVIPVFIMTFLFSHKYRASSNKAKYNPNWTHSVFLEIIWWTVPFIIIAILGTVTWITSHTLNPYKPLAPKEKSLTIQVIALDWKWLFIYPKQHIATVNFVQLPVHTPINFFITADAPMNSFMIPQLAGQIYAMSGMQTQLHILANKTGNYYGMSANYSGNGFAGMNFTARVSSKVAFKQWVNTVKRSSHQLTGAAYKQLAKPSEYHPVKYFASTTPKLFNKIIMKYTTPKTHGKYKELI